MAASTCPKCKSMSFEVKPNRPDHCTRNLIFVQCTACGAVVGVVEPIDLAQRIDDLERLLRGLLRGGP